MADLLWRVNCGSTTALKLPVDQALADGSWLARLYAGSDRRKGHPITVRVVEYTLGDPGQRTSVDRNRLLTTVLDPDRLSFVRTLRVIRRQVIAQPAFSS